MGLLDDRVALITGAASGIGAEIVRRFAAEGADVVQLDVQEEDAGLSSDVRGMGRESLFIQCDVRDDAALRAAFACADDAFRRIDVVVANAGINGMRAPIDAFPVAAFDELVSTNLRGTFLTIQAGVPYLKRRGGSVIAMASIIGTRTFRHPGTGVYDATKAGVVALAKALPLELGRYGIRVNSVCPGSTRTNIDSSTHNVDLETIETGLTLLEGSPAINQGIGDPDDMADVCLFLASNLSRHVSGATLFVDGGHSLLA
jgi:NAD(P)-dependent dehydrogenase (short-subunit alcohol dehydrogenase family)